MIRIGLAADHGEWGWSPEKVDGHLNLFYDALIASIREVKSNLIFGPGERKFELKKHLEQDKLERPMVGLKE